MVLQQTVGDVMSSPVLRVRPDTELREAVALLSEHHVSGLAVVNDAGELIGELTEQHLMVRERGLDAGPYVMLLDSVIYRATHSTGTNRCTRCWGPLSRT